MLSNITDITSNLIEKIISKDSQISYLRGKLEKVAYTPGGNQCKTKKSNPIFLLLVPYLMCWYKSHKKGLPDRLT